eukprot:362858-Chlamydomonas_euryale.AAC.8
MIPSYDPRRPRRRGRMSSIVTGISPPWPTKLKLLLIPSAGSADSLPLNDSSEGSGRATNGRTT